MKQRHLNFYALPAFIVGGCLLSALSGGAALAADSNTTVATKRPPDPEVAQTLWSQSCSACHGMKGLGDGPLATALGGIETLDGRIGLESMDAATGIVRNGKGKMPGFSETIDAGDTRRILEWIRDVAAGKIEPKSPKPPTVPNVPNVKKLPADRAVEEVPRQAAEDEE
jgi:mono/diheme cytochrome c family protein